MADLSSLIARLEKAEGPDTEIDARVWAYFAKVKYVSHNEPYGDCHGRSQVVFTTPPKRTVMVTNSPAFPHAEPITSSIDAAVSLAERVLPNWHADIDLLSPPPMSDKYGARLFDANGSWQNIAAEAVTPAIALVLATLRALQQKGSSNG